MSPAILKNNRGILDSPDPFIRKIPYDKAVMPVKRIDAFRIDDHGRGAVLFDPYKHALLPEVIANATLIAIPGTALVNLKTPRARVPWWRR